MEPAVSAWGVYNQGRIKLSVDRSSASGLSALLRDAFRARDMIFGEPPFRRVESDVFSFDMAELFQALPDHAPKAIAAMFRQHLDLDGPQEQAFLEQIAEAPSRLNLAVTYSTGFGFQLCPLNRFPVEIINKLRTRELGTRRKAEKRVLLKHWGVAAVYDASRPIDLSKLREAHEIYSKEGITIIHPYGRGNSAGATKSKLPSCEFPGRSAVALHEKSKTGISVQRIEWNRSLADENDRIVGNSVDVIDFRTDFIMKERFFPLAGFFDDLLRKRDRALEKPQIRGHIIKRESRIFFHIPEHELIETFLGTYPPQEFAQFLYDVFEDSSSLDEMIKSVLDAEKNYIVAFPARGASNGNRYLQLCPVNCTQPEFSPMLPDSCIGDAGLPEAPYRIVRGKRPDLKSRTFVTSCRLKTNNLPDLNDLLWRELFLNQEETRKKMRGKKGIAIIPHFKGPALNPEEIAAAYSNYNIQTY